MNDNNQRTLTPYEKNQLRKYNINQEILLKTNSPVEYITNHVDFCNLDFFVNNHVLIPRIETEELVELALKKIYCLENLNKNKIFRIIDVGTGSGAIAISIAKKLQDKNIKYEIIAIDISKKAMDIAKKNYQRIGNNLNIRFINNNLLFKINKKADIIIANLPYIPSGRIKKLDFSVRNYEPLIALDGGRDGLDLIKKLLTQAQSLITKKGLVLLELDITHTKKVMNQFENNWIVKIKESIYQGVYFGLFTLKPTI